MLLTKFGDSGRGGISRVIAPLVLRALQFEPRGRGHPAERSAENSDNETCEKRHGSSFKARLLRWCAVVTDVHEFNGGVGLAVADVAGGGSLLQQHAVLDPRLWSGA